MVSWSELGGNLESYSDLPHGHSQIIREGKVIILYHHSNPNGLT